MKSGIFLALAVAAAFAFSCADSPGTGDDGQQGSNQMTNNVCGDGTCATSEIGYCPTDCGSGNANSAVCGNGQCETTKGESASTCFSDCGGAGSGSGSGNTSALDCNDQNTQIGCLACQLLSSCTAPYDATSCAACGGGLGSGFGSGSGFGDLGCTGGAADGTCDSMEDASTCPSDCP